MIEQDLSTKILSDIAIYMKYAKYIPELRRRETWDEIVYRNKEMHLKKFPQLKDEIDNVYSYVYSKKVLPSMRGMQFSGKPIELSPDRIYNCCFIAIDNYLSFPEIMKLLLGGTGVGFSVQFHHIEKLPEITKPTKTKRYLIGDSIEGWADAIKVLFKAYMCNSYLPRFDFSDIRLKGARLITSGGKAPGPEPLKDCLHNIQKILDRKINGEKLTALEVHEICCFIADAVLAGGIRRSALISLFSLDDEEMLTCKFNHWWELKPHLARANNSAVILRHRIKKKDFFDLWNKVKNAGSGEPGLYFSNDAEMGSNPCQPTWAPLLTPTGIKKLSDVNVGDKIWSIDGWVNIVNKWQTGKKAVYKYRTTRSVFYGTENHFVMCNGERTEISGAEAVDYLNTIYEKEINIDKQDIIDGMVFGDGTVHKASNNLVLLCVGKNDFDYENSEIASFIVKPRFGIGPYAYEVKTTILPLELPKTYERIIPERFFYGSREKVAGFLKGLFTANGSICAQRITLKTSSSEVCEQVQLMLNSLGISSYYTTNKPSKIEWNNGLYTSKKSFDINISSDRKKFKEIIGFIQTYKNDKLNRLCESISDKEKPSLTTCDIKSVDLVSIEDVYDITVDGCSHTYWTGNCNVSNCCEVALHSMQMCNLCEINTLGVENQEELNKRSKAAAFIGTLQASYTDFHYLRDGWQKITEKEALLGIGMTGIASGKVLTLNLQEAVKIIIEENKRVAKLIGINSAARATLVKPAGTTSLVLGTSSGIHSYHSSFYLRRIRVGKNEAIYKYLIEKHPELIEDDYFKPHIQAVISIPQKAPEGAIIRNKETSLSLMERVKFIYENWVLPGHVRGNNTHNVSATISVKENEWDEVGKWLWENKNNFNGLSFLPYDGGTYVQAPFEEIDEITYNKLYKKLKDIDLTEIVEEEDNTELKEQAACAGGACEVV